MLTKDVTIGTDTFQIRKVPAYPDQLLLAKAFTPLAAELLPVAFKAIAAKQEGQKNIPPEILLEAINAALKVTSEISDQDMMNLVQRSLAAVQIKQGEAGWAAMMLPGGQLMYDRDLRVILELVFNVFEVNLMDFFLGGPGTSPDAPPPKP